ncbi:MAG: glycoside hydrolase family 3 protein [Saprospirales bacterium]|nr:glycoside hydrolase family 3 protein [Saprospirales bacterium]
MGSIMVAHLQVPAIDSTPNLPTTPFPLAIRKLMLEEMGFEGLVITDGLDMEGVKKYHRSGEVEAKALVAGNDILLIPPDVPAAVSRIKEYLAEGKLDPSHLEASVKKVLHAKYKLGLEHFTPVDPENLEADLNHPKGLAIKRKLIQHSLTLLRNERHLLPLDRIDTLEIASP